MLLSSIYKILGQNQPTGYELDISGLNSLKKAGTHELSYCDGEANVKDLEGSNAGAILVRQEHANLVKNHAIISKNPHLDFANISAFFAKPLFEDKHPAQVASSAKVMENVHIGSGVMIGENVIIMPGCYIGDNVYIGRGTLIHPNVVIYNNSKIGESCIINANAVIGSDGFGYAHTPDGKHVKIHHNGNVVIGNHVEIGACTTIDRGVFDSTVIADHCKIDNLVQIGHNCELGFGTILVSQVGLSGSSVLGRNVVMGGQAGTKGHIRIGDFVQCAARAGVSKDLPDNSGEYAGHPIMPLKEWFKLQAKIIRFFKKESK